MGDKPEFKISEERSNFFIIPNLVDDMGLDVYAFRLYCRIKRVAGDNGACWQSTTTLATACNMAAGSVTKAKNELLKRGLIDITKKKHDTGQYEYHEITVKNLWEGATVHVVNGNRSPGELNRSPHETKKNTVNKNPIKKSEGASAPRDPSLDDPNVLAYRDIAHLSMNKAQRYEVFSRVTDTEKWRGVVREWLGHGYNPKNVLSMIEIYEHGWQKNSGNKPGKKDLETILAEAEARHANDND